MSTCLFCEIAAGRVKAELVHEDADYVAFRDIAPKAPSHVLVIPRRHIASPAELGAILRRDSERWAPLIKAIGFTADS